MVYHLELTMNIIIIISTLKERTYMYMSNTTMLKQCPYVIPHPLLLTQPPGRDGQYFHYRDNGDKNFL